MQLFFNPDITKSSETLTFSKEESRHIVRSLRKTEGDLLDITDGRGTWYTARIVQAHDKKCIVDIEGWEDRPKPWNHHLHLAVAPTKLNDRFEWFLEKATEIGIDEITPLICDRSERRQVRNDRYEKVIVSAMKQSLKFNLPILNDSIKFKDFVDGRNWDLGLIAHCDTGEKKALSHYLPCHKKILILIGPEGDFTREEISAAVDRGIEPVTLGDSRLRTETAGIVACHTVALLNENK